MSTHEELDRLLTDLHKKLLSLPCTEGWEPVAQTPWGILDELRQLVQRKSIVVEMLESLFKKEESELVKLESRLCALEDEEWEGDEVQSP